jgi:hypothetical protein
MLLAMADAGLYFEHDTFDSSGIAKNLCCGGRPNPLSAEPLASHWVSLSIQAISDGSELRFVDDFDQF